MEPAIDPAAKVVSKVCRRLEQRQLITERRIVRVVGIARKVGNVRSANV